MKKIILAISLFVLCVILVKAQTKSNFEGVVTYSISFEGSGLPPEALAMFKDAESVIYLKGDKYRVDMIMPMQSTSSIVDNKNKNSVTLMEIMGKKFLIRMKESEIKKEQDGAPEIAIKYTDETKVIAGYKCKKAEIFAKNGKGNSINVFYTDEILNNNIKPVYKGLQGFPLEYSANQGGMDMKFTAKSIVKTPVADSKFEIAKTGYTETTVEGLQKEMTSQMGTK